MPENARYERLIAKLQHFADGLNQLKIDAEFSLITTSSEICQRDKVKDSIFLYDKILKEYYDVFDEILDR